MKIRALRQGERGDLNVEVAIGASILILLFGLALAANRVETAEGAVEEAARAAARAASLARDGEAAASAARLRAHDILAGQGLACATLAVTVDARDFAQPLGQPGYVTASVTCEIRLSALLIPGMGGTKTARSEFRSPIDRYGARG